MKNNTSDRVWKRLHVFLDDSMEEHVKELFSECWMYGVPTYWDIVIADLVKIMYKRERQYKTILKVAQVKTKFGGLRFYIDGPSDDFIYGAIWKAELECAKICSNCGSYGKEKLNTGRWNAGCVQCPKGVPNE
tara:strand:- start:334 stop:732 length:399 start_codon:yes stop_codon:yes gene_type:complete